MSQLTVSTKPGSKSFAYLTSYEVKLNLCCEELVEEWLSENDNKETGPLYRGLWESEL